MNKCISGLCALLVSLLLMQCNSLRSDCEQIALREKEIAAETRGDYYIGRRYYIPATRFWGYLRRPGESWRTAKLVMMDERTVRCPDRGPEDPLPNPTVGKDANVEYTITGAYTGAKAYDPSTDQALDLFRPTSFSVRNATPGFLFTPSEKYSVDYVTIRPQAMPTPEQCQKALKQ